MLKAFFNWLKTTGKGSETKQRELDEANAAPYKVETPPAPVAPVVETPAVEAPEAKAEAPVEAKPKAKRAPKAPKAEATAAKPKAPRKPKATPAK